MSIDHTRPDFAVRASGHGSGFRYDGPGDGKGPHSDHMRTYEVAVVEAERWISHACTIGGRAQVVHVPSDMVVWP